MNKDRTIFVFPGQGSQYVGMGAALCAQYPVARETFYNIGDITSRHVAKICFSGPSNILNQPINASLGTFAHAVAIARVIESEFGMPLWEIGDVMVGHSLGQYSALHCADSMSLADAAKLVSARSLYMSMGRGGAGMIAIVGLTEAQVEKLLFRAVGHGFAAISNHNARDQFIISGENEALGEILAGAVAHGARIACRLNVAVPAHCALMAPAAIKMRNRLARVRVRTPRVDWFSNQTADLMTRPADVKQSLIDQMTNGVRWYQIMEKFPMYNITRSYELGPGCTLSRLIRRAGVGVNTMHTDTVPNVAVVMRAIEADLKNRGGR